MIRNADELAAAIALLERLDQAIAAHRGVYGDAKPGERAYLVEQGLVSQREDIAFEINAFQALTQKTVVDLRHLSELGSILKMARVVNKMTQVELAKRLGIRQQQLQRYEASDYENVSFKRVSDVTDALGFKFQVAERRV